MPSQTSRRILSTYFMNPSLASIALDAAAQSSASINWIHNLDTSLARNDDESDSDAGGGWASSSKHIGGQAVIQIERNGLRFVAPISRNGERSLCHHCCCDRKQIQQRIKLTMLYSFAEIMPSRSDCTSCLSASTASCTGELCRRSCD